MCAPHPYQYISRPPGRDGDARRIAGIVTQVLEDLNPAKRKRITLSLNPRLRLLELTRGPVLWIGLDFKGLVRTLLQESRAGATRVEFAFNSEHPPRPWQLRGVGESSREMLARHLAREGICRRHRLACLRRTPTGLCIAS